MSDWKDMTPAERMEIIRPLWTDGVPAREIAITMFINASKNAVLGALNRAGLIGGPSGKSAMRARHALTRVKAPAIRHRLAMQQDIRPEKRSYAPLDGHSPIGIMDLPAREGTRCRWPVTGGYCGAPSGAKMYCETHQAIAYRPARELIDLDK